MIVLIASDGQTVIWAAGAINGSRVDVVRLCISRRGACIRHVRLIQRCNKSSVMTFHRYDYQNNHTSLIHL